MSEDEGNSAGPGKAPTRRQILKTLAGGTAVLGTGGYLQQRSESAKHGRQASKLLGALEDSLQDALISDPRNENLKREATKFKYMVNNWQNLPEDRRKSYDPAVLLNATGNPTTKTILEITISMFESAKDKQTESDRCFTGGLIGVGVAAVGVLAASSLQDSKSSSSDDDKVLPQGSAKKPSAPSKGR